MPIIEERMIIIEGLIQEHITIAQIIGVGSVLTTAVETIVITRKETVTGIETVIIITGPRAVIVLRIQTEVMTALAVTEGVTVIAIRIRAVQIIISRIVIIQKTVLIVLEVLEDINLPVTIITIMNQNALKLTIRSRVIKLLMLISMFKTANIINSIILEGIGVAVVEDQTTIEVVVILIDEILN